MSGIDIDIHHNFLLASGCNLKPLIVHKSLSDRAQQIDTYNLSICIKLVVDIADDNYQLYHYPNSFRIIHFSPASFINNIQEEQ